MERLRIAVEVSPSFEAEARHLVREIERAATAGSGALAEVLENFPGRLRQLIRRSVIPRTDRTPAEPEEETPLAVAMSSTGRPLGCAQSACAEFTRLRVVRGLARSKIADLAARKGFSISPSTIGNIESGAVAPNRRHAAALGAALELPPRTVLELLRNEAPAGFLLELAR